MSKTKNVVIDQQNREKQDWVKYLISTNLDQYGFGAYKPGRDCRNVTLHELMAYYYWPGDVRNFFLEMCQHALPDAITFKQKGTKITATMEWKGGKEWITFCPVSEEYAIQQGKIEMRDLEWIDHLRQDRKQGTRTLLNGQTTE